MIKEVQIFIKENLSLYFNEAKINLVYLLLFFECVKLYPKKEKKYTCAR